MANHVWTRTQVLSEKVEVHEQLFEWFGDLTGWNEPHIRGTVEPIFGKYEKYPMDEIGPKWILVEDMDRTDDNETYITLCSAWSFPEGYMEEFVKKMVELDEEATVKFSVDEESDDFLVGGYGSKKGFKWYEEMATIAWIWVGIVIGTVFGILVSGILASGKQTELEAENLHLKFVRDSLKEEIFRLDNQVKPKPRSKRRRK